ncbi:hypothetical protein [Bradyrhizobium japonicum]|uniref:hypothetical protein n=1 Tax=Bradyrhizobium japonicum TaxID=375 RepID=UPI000694350D|nr:hypothetical protein [Bradyrhizobium japonicum]
MFDAYIPIIEEWLDAAPDLSAVDLLSRLGAHAPGRFSGHQRRTAQRLVKNWRSKAARQLISGTEIPLSVKLRVLVSNLDRCFRRITVSRSLATELWKARVASGLLGLAGSNSRDSWGRFGNIVI